MVSSTPPLHFTPGEDPVPILQEAGWAPGPLCTGGKFRPHRDSIPDRLARSQSLYRLSYRDHSRKFRFPDYTTTAQDGGKVVSLMYRPSLPPGNVPGTHSCQSLSRPQGHSAVGRIMSMKNSNDISWDRTSDLPVCSTAP